MNYNWCSISSELQQAATAGGKRLTLARLVAAIEQRLPYRFLEIGIAHPAARLSDQTLECSPWPGQPFLGSEEVP